MEMFLFKSQTGESAIALSTDGASLPPRPGGWKMVSSLGDLSHMFGSAEMERLRADGYFPFGKEEPPSQRIEDWQPLPFGSFRLTERALQRAKDLHDGFNARMGGRSVLAFTWGPIWEKEKDSVQWKNLGTRLTLGAFPEADVPPGAAELIDGIPFLFQFDRDRLPQPRPSLIDLDGSRFVFGE